MMAAALNFDNLHRPVLLDEVVKPLKKVNIDDTEISCIKASVFFDPRIAQDGRHHQMLF